MITKAIILAGGLGTRFLPVTKAFPKEMLPIVNKPALQYIVEEAVAAGIIKLGILINRDKEAIRRYFAPDPALEAFLEKKGKTEFLAAIRSIPGARSSGANPTPGANCPDIEITFIYQDEPKGSGHAVSCCKGFIGKDDFALLNGDDVVFSSKPAIGQIIECFEKYNRTIVGVQRVPPEIAAKCGVVRVVKSEGNAHIISEIIEKPPIDQIALISQPSNNLSVAGRQLSAANGGLASLGRYAFRNDILKVLEKLPPAANGEIQLTDAINIQAKQDKAAACEFAGRRYDLGSTAGFIEANVEYALRDKEIARQVEE